MDKIRDFFSGVRNPFLETIKENDSTVSTYAENCATKSVLDQSSQHDNEDQRSNSISPREKIHLLNEEDRSLISGLSSPSGVSDVDNSPDSVHNEKKFSMVLIKF